MQPLLLLRLNLNTFPRGYRKAPLHLHESDRNALLKRLRPLCLKQRYTITIQEALYV
nr:MAG TPA: hypothetical protein [Caudoviricetes sp.]